MVKDFYILKMITSFNGVRCVNWFKVLDTPKGMSWYKCNIQNNKVTWEFDEHVRGNFIRDFEHKFIVLDYNPNLHDKMIINDIVGCVD